MSTVPTSQLPSTGTTQVPGPGVPKVNSPIDINKFLRAPCTTLSTDQVTELLGANATSKPDPSASAPSCFWHAPGATQASVGVLFPPTNDLGLTSFYNARGKTYPFFKELAPIDGYPIVAFDAARDRTSEGRCDVAVGTSDQTTVGISIAQSEAKISKKDPCDTARTIAAQVLDNVRKG